MTSISSKTGQVLDSIHYGEEASDTLEAIAIIGFSFKFPGEADSCTSFWSMLEQRQCQMTEWPQDRINLDAFHHRDVDDGKKVGKTTNELTAIELE